MGTGRHIYVQLGQSRSMPGCASCLGKHQGCREEQHKPCRNKECASSPQAGALLWWPKAAQTTAASQARISWQLKEERQLPSQTATQINYKSKTNQLPHFQLKEMAIHRANLGRGVCAAELWAPQHLHSAHCFLKHQQPPNSCLYQRFCLLDKLMPKP